MFGRRIKIEVWTERFLGTAELCSDFLDLIDTWADGSLRPDKWNYYEPLRHVYAEGARSAILSRWAHERAPGWVANSLFFRKKKPRIDISLNIWRSSRPALNSVHFSLEANRFRDPSEIINLVKRLIAWSGGVYATVRHSDQKLWRVAQLTPLTRLQQLEWLTYFGPLYVHMFGEERVQTAGFHRLENFRDGCMALSAPTPDDPALTESEILLLQLEEALGADAFAGRGYPAILCRVPQFDLSEVTSTDGSNKLPLPEPVVVRRRGKIAMAAILHVSKE